MQTMVRILTCIFWANGNAKKSFVTCMVSSTMFPGIPWFFTVSEFVISCTVESHHWTDTVKETNSHACLSDFICELLSILKRRAIDVGEIPGIQYFECEIRQCGQDIHDWNALEVQSKRHIDTQCVTYFRTSTSEICPR